MLIRSEKRAIFLFSLALAAFFSWWLLRSVEPKPPQQSSQLRHDPDYYLENFELTSMNDEGIPKHHLYAENLYHYPDDDTSTLGKPHLVIYQHDAQPWDIIADKGLISENGKRIFLQGSVIIKRGDAESGNALEIITSDLEIDTEDEFADTTQPIIIKDGYGTTEAVGMRMDLKKRRFALISQVRGNYTPKK